MLWPPARWQPASRATVGAPAQHLGGQLEGQPVARPGQQVDRDQRLAAHRVDVGERVGGRDPAPVVGVVDDRREEVGGRPRPPGRPSMPDHGARRRRSPARPAGRRRRGRRGSPASTRSSSPGGTLQAHPPPAAYWVRRRGSSSVMRVRGYPHRGRLACVESAGALARQPLPLRDDGVLRVAGRGQAGLEDPEPGEHRAGDAASRPRPRDTSARAAGRAASDGRRAGGQRAARPASAARAALLGRARRPCRADARSALGRGELERRARRRAIRRAGPACATGVSTIARPAGGGGARAGEHERQLAVRLVPGGHGGVGEQRGGVGRQRRPERGGTEPGRAGPAAGSRPVSCEAAAAAGAAR